VSNYSSGSAAASMCRTEPSIFPRLRAAGREIEGSIVASMYLHMCQNFHQEAARRTAPYVSIFLRGAARHIAPYVSIYSSGSAATGIAPYASNLFPVKKPAGIFVEFFQIDKNKIICENQVSFIIKTVVGKML